MTTPTRYPLYLSLSFAFLASLLCLPRRTSPSSFNIHTAAAESDALRRPRPRSLSQSQAWKMDDAFDKIRKTVPLRSPPPDLHPVSSIPFSTFSSSIFPVHVTSATLWVARIPPLASKSQIGRNANLQRYIAPGVWAPARSSLVRWIFHYGTRWKLTRARPLLPMGLLKLRTTVAPSLFHPLTTYNVNSLESSTRLFHLITLGEHKHLNFQVKDSIVTF